MNFVADEGVDSLVVGRLREEGHSVFYVAEMEPGVTDETVLDLANREAAILLTSDRDFGELVFRLRRVHSGVILTRLPGLSPEAKADTVARAVAEHASEYAEAFAVITPGNVRIRRVNG